MVWTIVSGVAVLATATYACRFYGIRLKGRPFWVFVVINAVVIIAATALVALAFMPGTAGTASSDVLFGCGLGLGFGGPSGLRYGYKGLGA
jgi:hypothetical protein